MNGTGDGVTFSARLDWAMLGDGSVLHLPVTLEDPDGFDDGDGSAGVVACGRRGGLWRPGVLSRLGAPRCARCCTASGTQPGVGSPRNDDTLRAALGAG